jgi:hypothetical protein
LVNKSISQAIKASRWLAIEYENADGALTNYWIAIKDFNAREKAFLVDAFNFSKMSNDSQGVIETWIKFERIKDAFVVDNTSYNQPSELITNINIYVKDLEWLGYDSYTDETLDYIYECIKQDEVPYQEESTLVRKIDQELLEELPLNYKYPLTYEQMGDLVSKLEILSKNDKKHKFEEVTLAFNLLSISTRKGIFVVAYKELFFNPVERSLMLGKDTLFNYAFTSLKMDNFIHHLKHYLDIETDDFTELFLTDPETAKNRLQIETKRRYETLDDRPFIFELKRAYLGHIEREISQIKLNKANDVLTTPLEAYFGNMSKDKLKRKKDVDVVVLNNKANIDQLRVIYNALIQPITYVQGPPGTGKTATIINVLISAFFNKQTVLVSSNNNKPISDILEKLKELKSRDTPIPLPFLRLGNNEQVLQSLNYLRDILPKIVKFTTDDAKLAAHAINKKERMKAVNEILERYEEIIDTEEEIDALRSLHEKLKDNLKSVAISAMLSEKEEKLNCLPPVNEEDIEPLLTKVDNYFLTWLFFTSVKHLKRIYEPKYKDLLNIIQHTDDEERVKELNKYTMNEDNMHNLLRIFPVILTTNQSSFRLGALNDVFDLVILDEAGQCSIGHSLFAIARGTRLLLVGDQNQLKPVVTIAPETNHVLMKKFNVPDAYDYLRNSILLTMQKQDTISKYVLLRYHYRSRKDIIEFSNKKYYKGQLIIKTEEEPGLPSALELINIKSSHIHNPQIKNVARDEVAAILTSIKSEKSDSIGIITPFRNQAELIQEAISSEGLNNVVVGTVHVLQGDEKDIIYLSTAITANTLEKTFDWVKNNQELLNVASTRARKKLVLVTDLNQIRKRSVITNDLFELTEYIAKNGKNVKLTESSTTSFINGANFKSYNTKKEQEFFDTINHILTFNDRFILKSKVRVASVLDKFTSPKKYDYGLKAEFDLVIYKTVGREEIPVLVIELDGDEHHLDFAVQRRDKIKEDICLDNNIKIERIHNDYSRRYMYIKDILKEVFR